MNLNSYLTSWWINDPSEFISEEAYRRFMAWMAEPNTVKTDKAEGWEGYTFAAFREDMVRLRGLGLLHKLHKAKDWPNPRAKGNPLD